MTHRSVSATRRSQTWLLALTLTFACGGQRPLEAEVVDDAAGRAQPSALVAPTPPSVAGRLKVSVLSTKVWIDNERLGPLRKLDHVALYTRLRDRRGSEPGAHAASFELEVDATATTSQILTLYWLSVHAGYRRAELITWAGRTTLCSIDCSAGADEENAVTAARTVLIVQDHGMSVWRGEQLKEEVPASARTPERLLDAPWRWKDDALEVGMKRACAEPPGCSRVTTYIDPYTGSAQLKRSLAVLERLGGARDVVLELQDAEPPAPGDEASAFRVPRSTNSGRLPLAVSGAILSRHGDEIFRCSVPENKHGLRWLKLRTRVTLNFVISAAGAVTEIGVSSGEPSADALGCVIEVLEGLRFPPPEGGPARRQMAFPVSEWR